MRERVAQSAVVESCRIAAKLQDEKEKLERDLQRESGSKR
jgi:hypothetical protein